MKYFHLAIAGVATVSALTAQEKAENRALNEARRQARTLEKAARHAAMEAARNAAQAAKDQRNTDRATGISQAEALRELRNLNRQARVEAHQQAMQNRHTAKQAAMAAAEADRDQRNQENEDAAAFHAWEKSIQTMLRREAMFEKMLIVKGWEEIEGIPRGDFPMYAQAKFTSDGDLSATSGCRGDVFFKQTSFSQMEVYYQFLDCLPSHNHKFHIHAEYNAENVGDCVGLAGGHFNPWNGADTSDMYYITNMGNVMTESDGSQTGQASRPHYVRLTDVMSPDGGVTDTSVLGKSIVVHDAAGPRIACGGPITKVDNWVAGFNEYLPAEN